MSPSKSISSPVPIGCCSGPLVKKDTDESKRTAVSQYLGLTLIPFVTGLVSTAVTGVAKPWVKQLVDTVGAAVLYLNVDRAFATVSIPANTDFSLDCTLGHCRMIFTQPGREACTTFVH